MKALDLEREGARRPVTAMPRLAASRACRAAGFTAGTRFWLACLATVPLGMPAALGAPGSRIEQGFTVGEAPRVEITHVMGPVTLRGNGSARLGVVAEKRYRGPGSAEAAASALARVRVVVSGSVGKAQIQVVYDGESDWGRLKTLHREGKLPPVEVSLDVSLPEKSRGEVSSVEGPVTVEGIRGGLIVDTVSAAMDLRRVAGGCKVAAISGKLRLLSVDGGLSVQSVQGDVTGEAIAGSCVVDTVSGAVSLSILGSEAGTTRVNTMNGEVTVAAPLRRPLHYRLESGKGALKSDFPAVKRGQSMTGGTRSAEGHDIVLTSQSGGLYLRSAPPLR